MKIFTPIAKKKIFESQFLKKNVCSDASTSINPSQEAVSAETLTGGVVQLDELYAAAQKKKSGFMGLRFTGLQVSLKPGF